MKRLILVSFLSILLLACGGGALHADAQELPAVPNRAAGPKPIVIPAGTQLLLVLQSGVSTRAARSGQPLYFETLAPVAVEDRIAIPAGSFVLGEMVQLKRAGRVKGRAEMNVRLTQLILPNGYTVSLEATPAYVSTGGDEAVDDKGKIKGETARSRDVGIVLAGTAIGTYAGMWGTILTKNENAIRIGTVAGAGAGLLAVLVTRGPDAELPRGTTMNAVLHSSLELDAARVDFSDAGHASVPSPPERKSGPHRHPGFRLPRRWP